MADVMEAGSGAMATARESGEGDPGLGRGGRMSRQRKREAVLRLLRGEDLETVSRALGVTAAALAGWRDAFLTGGAAALATKPADAKDLEVDRLRAKLGEVVLERGLLAEKVAALEAGRPLARRRPR
jgi:transposase-like protein